MKALLVSRVIAKAPLCNANDIRGLSRAKVAFEAKGYEDEDLMKLLIVTHRLWTPKRMEQFVRQHLGCFCAALQRLAAPLCMCVRALIYPRDDRVLVGRGIIVSRRASSV